MSVIESNGLTLLSAKLAGPASWNANHIIFFAQTGDTNNLWQVAINPKTWHVEHAPERLTTGAGQEVDPSVSTDGQLVFATTDERLNLWILPMDANSGKAMGKPQPLTQSAAGNAGPPIGRRPDACLRVRQVWQRRHLDAGYGQRKGASTHRYSLE
jgi:hypothetical protein